MQMEMFVRIDVIEFEAGRRKRLELSFDLGGQLAAHLRPQEHGKAGAHHVAPEHAAGVHQIGNVGRRQRRPAFHQHQMQTHRQRHRLGARHGVGGGRRRDHQAGGGENTLAMRALDRVVDLDGGAEIVRGDDQSLRGRQAACSLRSLRNWKNSTPSRRRRFIMSVERNISPTMEAILPGRK